MREKESRPAANQAANDLGGSSTYKDTRLVGHTVETQLDTVLWQLISGEIGLDDLSPALVGWWTLAYDAGRLSMSGRISRLEFLADQWYFCYANKKTPVDFRRRHTDKLWDMAVTS